MSFWSVARIQREALALHTLGLLGYEVYLPRLRAHRVMHGRKIELRRALFPGYCFVQIELQWHAARWAPGVIGLVMDGIVPARVPQNAIEEIRRREVGGLIVLERQGAKRGDRVRILRGPFEGHLAIYHDSKPRDRIEVLLKLLGSTQRATLASLDVELVKRSGRLGFLG
jgi:transcriptional antiterminator RfaH